MNGKTFSIDVLGGLPYVSVRSWIDKNGGDSSTVKFVELAFSEMTQAINSGRVDVSEMNVAYDPLIGKPNDPLHLLGNSYESLGPRYCSSLWFSTSDWVSKNPDAARKFVAVMKQAARVGERPSARIGAAARAAHQAARRRYRSVDARDVRR